MVHDSLTQSPFLNFVHIIFKKHDFSEADSASIFNNEERKLVSPLQRAILSHWVPQKHSAFYDMHLRTDQVYGK